MKAVILRFFQLFNSSENYLKGVLKALWHYPIFSFHGILRPQSSVTLGLAVCRHLHLIVWVGILANRSTLNSETATTMAS
jgi:hypothetical protein